jgi:DNA-binding response OmpR family regulator
MANPMSTPKEKILLFEDLKTDYESLWTALNAAGYEIVHAETPDKLRQHANNGRFAAAVIDFFLGQFPNADPVGIKLTRELKELHPTLSVFLISDQTPDRNQVAEAFVAGASGYVDKKVFLADVRTFLEEARSRLGVSDEQRQEDEFPLPIAYLLRDYRHSRSTYKRTYEKMMELFRATLYFSTFTLMAAHRASLHELLTPKLRAELGRPSLGTFENLLVKLPAAENFLRPLTTAVATKKFRKLCSSFISLRNRTQGHGMTLAEPEYKKLVGDHADDIAEFISRVNCLRRWRLVRPLNTLLDDNDDNVYEALVFQGSHPFATQTCLRTNLLIRPTKHVHLLDEELTDSVDLFPWCQYLECENRCHNEKIFLYNSAHENEIWMLDHVVGHSLMTRQGWPEVKQLITVADRKSKS